MPIDPNRIFREIDDLLIPCRYKFRNLRDALAEGFKKGETLTEFRLFETWRSTERQEMLVRKGTSKAGPWRSAHNFGLAGDFVGWISHPDGTGSWSWDDNHDYAYLGRLAVRYGLTQPFPDWDPYHIEDRDTFLDLRARVRDAV